MVETETPKADIYTAMLGVSLVALIVATILMALEWARFGPPENVGRAAPRVGWVPAELVDRFENLA